MDKKVMDIRLKSWIPIFEAQARSGLSKKDFCLQNNFCRGTFYKWQGILWKRISEGWDPQSSTLSLSDCQDNESIDDDRNKFFEIPTSSYSISETDSMMSEESAIKNFYSSSEAKYVNDPRYLNQIKEQSENFEWKDVNEKDYESIKNSFQAKISSEVSDERVAKEMLRLFGDSKWSGIGGNK